MRWILRLCAVWAFIGSVALAHSTTEKTVPANASSVTEVPVIAVHFDAPIRITSIRLTGPDGEVAIANKTGLDATKVFEAQPPENLPPGPYAVEWRGLAADGHLMQGTFGFNLAK